jgi:predicted MFS family arabinose efflux permease
MPTLSASGPAAAPDAARMTEPAVPAGVRPRFALGAAMLGFFVVGLGGSFTVPPITSLLLDAVHAHRAGLASSVLKTFRQLGGSLGVAVFGAVVARQASFLAGLRASLAAVAALLVIATVATVTLRRRTPDLHSTPSAH